MHEKLFNLDSIPNVAFEGYSTGEQWNGFEVPFFTRSVAESILREMYYKGMIRAFIFNDYVPVVYVEWVKPLLNGTENVSSYAPLSMKGVDEPLWPIGTWEWVWWDVTGEWDKCWESDWWTAEGERLDMDR